MVFFTAFLVGLVLGLIFLLVSRLVAPPRRVGDKNIVYESGVRPLPSRLHYLAEKYFPFIIIYVAFDAFTAFLVSTLYYSSTSIMPVMIFSVFVFAALVAAEAAGLAKWG